MTDNELTIPVANEPLETQLAQLRRWIEGYTDKDGSHKAGLIEMVGELYEELKARRERREAIGRALTSGGILATVVAGFAWLKDHLK